jgi:uncharacterized protein (DUF924 family)
MIVLAQLNRYDWVMKKLKELHQFWFDKIEISNNYYERKVPQWFFGKDVSFDLACRENFSSLLDKFIINDFIKNQSTPQDYLSLVLLLDQIPRNSFRGSAKAFAFDELALQLCLEALGTQTEMQLSFPEKLFLYLPLEHSENSIMQDLSVKKYTELHENSPLEIKKWTELALKKAFEHQSTIIEFGRFPSRDRVMNRL